MCTWPSNDLCLVQRELLSVSRKKESLRVRSYLIHAVRTGVHTGVRRQRGGHTAAGSKDGTQVRFLGSGADRHIDGGRID